MLGEAPRRLRSGTTEAVDESSSSSSGGVAHPVIYGHLFGRRDGRFVLADGASATDDEAPKA